MRIGIQADGGADVGMGHIMRTSVLAKELKSQNNDVFYICRIESNSKMIQELKFEDNLFCNKILGMNVSNKYKKGIEKITSEGFKICFVRENCLPKDISNISADVLITDSYDVDEEYFNETKGMFKSTVYIDDMNLNYFNVDILINQNINAEDLIYRTSPSTKLLLGTKYLMLREEFRDLPQKNIKSNILDVMITVGGADPYHVTENILEIVKDSSYRFHVVIGPSFSNNLSLSKIQNNNINVHVNPNMYEIMKKCDLAIAACGSTLYELAACGVPTLGIVLADNQLGIAKKLHSIGAINNLGWYNKISNDKFLYELEKVDKDLKLRENMSILGRSIVDGKGVERIAKIITSTMGA